MKITAVELRRITLPLVAPFTTSFGTQTVRDVMLIRVETAEAVGWGECAAFREPLYSSEYVDAVCDVLRRFFIPAVMAAPDASAHRIGSLLAPFKGHRMAKAALETAVLDAELRVRGLSFAQALGGARDRVPAGVSVGIMGSIPALLDTVEAYLAEGYARIKLKIAPGWDIAPVRAVRERFGDDVMLQVDANAAYALADGAHLAKLDPFDLLLIEQPLGEDDLRAHAVLAKTLRTPICLDESITSAKAAADAIVMGATSVINIKPGRVGGYLEAKRIHDLCLAHGVPVWCGGMLETGIGRAANLALAALPNFVLPGDVSASGRYYATDVTTPFTLVDGFLEVPRGAGIGVEPDTHILEELTQLVEVIKT